MNNSARNSPDPSASPSSTAERSLKRKYSCISEAEEPLVPEENNFVDLIEASTYIFKEIDEIEVRDLSILITPPSVESTNEQARGSKRKIDDRITDEAYLEEGEARSSSPSRGKKQKTRNASASSAPALIERPKASSASRRLRSPHEPRQTSTSDSISEPASLPYKKYKGKEKSLKPSPAVSPSSDRRRDSPVERRSRSPTRRGNRCETFVERIRSPLRQVSSVRQVSKVVPPWSMPVSAPSLRTHVVASVLSTDTPSVSKTPIDNVNNANSEPVASSSSSRIPASSSCSEVIASSSSSRIPASSSSSEEVSSSSTARVTASSSQAAGDRPPAASNAEEFDKCRIFEIMSRRLAIKTEHRGDSRIQTKAGVLDHFHALCSYMLSFYYADKIGRGSIRDSIVTWKKLFPFCEKLLRNLDRCGMYELRPLVHRLMGHIRFYLFGRSQLQLPTRPLLSDDHAVRAYLEFAASSFREQEKALNYYRMTEDQMSSGGIRATFPKTFEDVCVRGDLSNGIVLDGEAGSDIKPMDPFKPYSELNHSAIIARCLLKEYAEKNDIDFTPITEPEEFM